MNNKYDKYEFLTKPWSVKTKTKKTGSESSAPVTAGSIETDVTKPHEPTLATLLWVFVEKIVNEAHPGLLIKIPLKKVELIHDRFLDGKESSTVTFGTLPMEPTVVDDIENIVAETTRRTFDAYWDEEKGCLNLDGKIACYAYWLSNYPDEVSRMAVRCSVELQNDLNRLQKWQKRLVEFVQTADEFSKVVQSQTNQDDRKYDVIVANSPTVHEKYNDKSFDSFKEALEFVLENTGLLIVNAEE